MRVAIVGFIAVVIVTGMVWKSGWDPFLSKDYEDCIESAAKNAKSKEALAILVSSCSSKFVGRRNVRGGYTYYDGRQNLTFSIVGPNPTTEEWSSIEKRYEQSLRNAAELEETIRQREAELYQMQQDDERQAAIIKADQERKLQIANADLERRRQAVIPKIIVASTTIECLYPVLPGCSSFKLATTIRNNTWEKISMISVGWVFIGAQENCPTYIQTNRQEQVKLGPDDSIVLNIDGFDGPASKQFRYCVKVTNAQIIP